MKQITMQKPRTLADWFRLRRLYMSAFPASERKPFGMILRMWKRGKTDIWCLTAGGSFCGLAITINGPDLILLDYFAVEKSRRGQGLGRAALASILERYDDKGLFLEIESPYETGADQQLRQRRKQFYLSCGLKPLGVMVLLFGVKMELLGSRCSMDFERYQGFFRENYSQWVAEHVAPEEYPKR